MEHSSACYQDYLILPHVKFHFQLPITLQNFDPPEQELGWKCTENVMQPDLGWRRRFPDIIL